MPCPLKSTVSDTVVFLPGWLLLPKSRGPVRFWPWVPQYADLTLNIPPQNCYIPQFVISVDCTEFSWDFEFSVPIFQSIFTAPKVFLRAKCSFFLELSFTQHQARGRKQGLWFTSVFIPRLSTPYTYSSHCKCKRKKILVFTSFAWRGDVLKATWHTG